MAGRESRATVDAVNAGDVAVGVVVVTYESPPELLARCLGSIAQSVGANVSDVIVVDNASSTPPVVPAGARLLRRPSNNGFAAAVNHGVAALSAECSFVFLLNPDAALAPDALARCASALLGADDRTVAVAPKMLLATSHADGRPTIDAVGIGVNAKAEAANRGLGQPDLGQYDQIDDVFGACFGAALIRRSAFNRSAVGPVDETLFLYYEDVAWCWAAQLLGYRIISEPRAMVTHVMSAGVVRERPYGFKFRFTERNLLLCALMFLEPSHAARVVTRRGLGLLRGSLRGNHFPVAGLRALAGAVWLLPHALAVRQRVTRRRTRTDAEIMAYRADEPIFYDSVRYEVLDRPAAAAYAQRRLAGKETV